MAISPNYDFAASIFWLAVEGQEIDFVIIDNDVLPISQKFKVQIPVKKEFHNTHS